ncbi:MAG TPA: formate dehydrogenase subunit alpha, partial [Planctomycetes bacterium]|nr:formate dehydrogenase subunit alpha [Planctomycetota bacterium]
AGACRTCLVEVEGSRRLLPACATRARDGMKVTTENPRIERHRRSLLALYLTDQPADPERRERGAPNQLIEMAERFDAPTDWGHLASLRADRPGDANPYVDYDAATCILCARCTRYCAEVESVTAIGLTGRGSATTISTADARGLLDTSCELCGGCIAVCPTGAMAEKLPLVRGEKKERALEKVRSTCNFCGVGCQVDLNVDRDARGGAGRVVKVTSPEPGQTTNDGNLCVKGRFAYDFIHHDDRLTTPLVRGENGELSPASWDEALAAAAAGLARVRDTHGADALAFVSSSRCTVEENYLVQKLARAVFRTNNVHQCAAT